MTPSHGDEFARRVRQVRARCRVRDRLGTISTAAILLLLAIAAVLDYMAVGLSLWRALGWAFLGGMVVTVALQVTARRWLRLVDGLGLLPGVADVAPRDPVAVQRHLNAEQADSAGREALEARGVVAPLRDDVWALAVAGGLRRHEQVTLIAGRLAGDRVGPVGMDELTVGVDLLDCRDLAVGWARGRWVGVYPDGSVRLGDPTGTLDGFEPAIPEPLELDATGDSAGLALFLAYVADMLGVRADARFAVAASGDLAGSAFGPVGGIREKVDAVALARPCALFLARGQRLGPRELNTSRKLVFVAGASSAARAFLEVRAGLEARCRPDPAAGSG